MLLRGLAAQLKRNAAGRLGQFPHLSIVIHLIFYRLEALCDLFVHPWYADDGMFVGKIDQFRLSLNISAKQGASINFSFNLSESKAFWPTQDPLLLFLVTKAYNLNLQPTFGRVNIFGIPLGFSAFVSSLFTRRLTRL